LIFDTMLITGCGGDIALALARIARQCGAVRRLIGCDIHDDHPGGAFYDTLAHAPRADDPTYLEGLKTIVAANRVDVIVPMSEAEMTTLLSADALAELGGVPVIMANRVAVATGLDKLATIDMLARNGVPAPWTTIVGSAPPASVPCILKLRRGQGSKGLRRVEMADDVERLCRERPGALWQELLLPDDQEYTCGLYRSRNGEIRTLIFRRKLQGGHTVSGEVVASAAIGALLERIAVVLDLSGSVNVQLRLTAEGPRVFEINPRFSGTVGFRHKMGFRDFVWSLLERKGLAIEAYCPPRPGTRFYRGANEIIID
jgi:carbamoyl-phosphate synthase large subunit